MEIAEFEALGLRYSDQIWIQDSEGDGHWGKYLEDFDPENQTFVFQSRDNGQRMSVHIPSVQKIER